MKKVTFEIPDHIEVNFDKMANTFRVTERPKDVLERILTDEDVLADNGHTWLSFNQWCEGLPEHERATRFVELLAKSLNEGWIPDIDKPNEPRYEPIFTGGSAGFRYDYYGFWATCSYVGSRLCLKESRLAEHAGKKFTRWYKSIIVINQNKNAA